MRREPKKVSSADVLPIPIWVANIIQGQYIKSLITLSAQGASMGPKTEYPHKSCPKWAFFKGRGWDGSQSQHYDQIYKLMKRFGKAAITTLYNAQSKTTRKAWCDPEVRWQTQELLHRLLKDLHPNRVCRRLLAESDMVLLKHITYQTQREFRIPNREHLESGECIDEEWIPEVYAEALDGSIRPLHLADDHADLIDEANRAGLNDAFDFNTFSSNASSPSAFSPLLDSNSNIEDVEAVGDLDLTHGHYTSQDTYILPLPPNHAAIEPNLKTTVNHYDTEFLMATSVGNGVPLPNTHIVDEDLITMDNFVSTSSWNDTHWDAFVDTETSAPMEDIDTILKNTLSVHTPPTIQAPDTTQLGNTFPDWNYGWDVFDISAPSENANIVGDFSTAPLNAQPAMQVPDINLLNNASLNGESWWDFVDFDSLPGGNTASNEYANASAIPLEQTILSTNANANDIGNYYSLGRGISTSPNGSGNAASYLPLGSSFDREGNAAWDPNDWTTIDWTTIDLRLPDLNAPRAGHQDYNVDWSPPDLNPPHTPYHPSTSPS